MEHSASYFPCEYKIRAREYSKQSENRHDLYETVFTIENSKKAIDWLYSDCSIYLDRKYKRYQLFKKHDFEIPYTESELKETFGII